MYLRIGTDLVLGLLATFMVVASLVFSAGLVAWLMVALAVLALVAMAQVGRSRAVAEQVIDAATVMLALWTLAASIAFSGTTLTWLSFGTAVGFSVLALAGTAAATVVALARKGSEAKEAPGQASSAPLVRRPERLGTAA